MKYTGSFGVLAAFILILVSACPDGPDGHDHDHEKRHSGHGGSKPATVSISSPTTPLVWGDVCSDSVEGDKVTQFHLARLTFSIRLTRMDGYLVIKKHRRLSQTTGMST